MSAVNPNKRERPDSGLMEEQDMELRPMDDEDDDENDTTAGDKLHMRLLLMEDKERSALMWRQVSAFQEKVMASLNAFSPEIFLTNLRALSSLPNQNPIVVSSIHSLARLRMVVQQQLRAASMRSDGSIYFAGAEGESSRMAKCTQYFVWFFEFMDYLHELHNNFVERIFLPLFKFFHEISFIGGRSRASTAASTFSKISLLSMDSSSGDADDAADNAPNGYGIYSSNNGGSGSYSRQEVDDDLAMGNVDTARRRVQSKTALQLLSREFKEIKSLYDTADVDKVVQRLSVLKDQLDFILEEEDEMDPDLFSAESGQRLYQLVIDEGTENLIRLPIDLLVKFRKAVWLAQRWLELYDKRTHDLNTKLKKVQSLEHNLTRRLQSLDGTITQHERQLERQTDQLNRLMKREERTDGLGLALYDIEAKARALKEQMAALRRQRDTITADIKTKVAQKGQHHEYRRLKLDFEKNKLQRYLAERHLATLDYQRHLNAQDRNLELEMRPCLIRHTNHLQDSCERLEQTIREERRERDNIRSALLPVQEDRQVLSDQLSRLTAKPPDHGGDREGESGGEGGGGEEGRRRLRAGQAKFVRTYRIYNNKSSGVHRSNSVNNKNNGVVMPAARSTPRGVGEGGVGVKVGGSYLAVPSPPPAVPGWVSPPEW